MNKIKGTVTWFNDAKGFGFIRSEGIAGDIFVHYSAIVTDGFKTLPEGAEVEFELRSNPKGDSAMNVVKLSNGIQADYQEECNHDDHEDGTCLDCGEDMMDILTGRAEHYLND